jgi:hypothetical protein
MYCSSCGSAVKRSLRYCNHCGNELNTKELSSTRLSEKTQESIVWAIAVVTIVGLGGTIGLMAVMKEVLHFNDGLIIAFTLLFFLTFLVVDLAFMRLLWQSKKDDRKIDASISPTGLTTKDLEDAPVRILPEPPISIAEHTTHNLEVVDSRNKR